MTIASTPTPVAPVAPVAATVPVVVDPSVDAFLRVVGAELLGGLTPTEEGLLTAARGGADPAVRALTLALAYSASAAKASTPAAQSTEYKAAFAARRVHAHLVGLTKSPSRWRWALLPTAAVAAAEASTAGRLRHEIALAAAERRHAAAEAASERRHEALLDALVRILDAVDAVQEAITAPITAPVGAPAPAPAPVAAPVAPSVAAPVAAPPPNLSRKQRRAWAIAHGLDPATVS